MASMIRISEVEDPRLDDYRDLRDADLRGARKLFTVESERVLSRYLASDWSIESVLVEADVAERLNEALGALEDGVPVYVTEPGLLRSISGYGFHGGALALGRRAPRGPGLDALKSVFEQERITLLAAEGVVHVDNLGALFRNGACLGTDGILLAPDCSDPLLRKAIRISTGRVFEVPWAWCEDWPRTLTDLRDNHGFRILGLENGPAAEDIEQMECGSRNLILVGAEGHGLSRAALEQCDQILEIPGGRDRPVGSMNVAVASAIGLHELGRRRRRSENLDLRG